MKPEDDERGFPEFLHDVRRNLEALEDLDSTGLASVAEMAYLTDVSRLIDYAADLEVRLYRCQEDHCE